MPSCTPYGKYEGNNLAHAVKNFFNASGYSCICLDETTVQVYASDDASFDKSIVCPGIVNTITVIQAVDNDTKPREAS